MGLCSSGKSEKQHKIALTHEVLSDSQLPGRDLEATEVLELNTEPKIRVPQENTEYRPTQGGVLDIFEGKAYPQLFVRFLSPTGGPDHGVHL